MPCSTCLGRGAYNIVVASQESNKPQDIFVASPISLSLATMTTMRTAKMTTTTMTMTSTEMTMTTTEMARKKVVVGHSFKIMEVKG